MEMQQIVEKEPGERLQGVPCSGDIFLACVPHVCDAPPSYCTSVAIHALKGKGSPTVRQGREREETPFSAASNQRIENTAIKSVRRCPLRPAAANGRRCPAGGTKKDHASILASIVEMGEAQLPLVRIMGGEPVMASSRGLKPGGGENCAVLSSSGPTGKHSGFGAKTGAFLDHEAQGNDGTIKVLPFQGHTAYIASDSDLTIRPKKTKAGYHGPWLAAVEQPMPAGASKVTWNIEAGAEVKNIARTAGEYRQIELHIRQALGGSGSDDVGCIVAVRFQRANRRGCDLGDLLERRRCVRQQGNVRRLAFAIVPSP